MGRIHRRVLYVVAALGLVAAGLLAFDRFGFRPRLEVQLDEFGSPAEAQLHFSITNPNLFFGLTSTKYECIFEFPDLPRKPGLITASTTADDRSGPIAANSTKDFDCLPFIPNNLKSRILARILFSYHGRLLLSDQDGTLATPVYLWSNAAGQSGWEEQDDAGTPACTSGTDPLFLCHHTGTGTPVYLEGVHQYISGE